MTFLRRILKHYGSTLDRAVDRRTLPRDRFIELLGELGCRPGATVMIHSSMSEIRRRVPGLTPQKLIGILQELLGSAGTLLMPTFPFLGRQMSYVDAHNEFNIETTPSLTGALTEVFRQTPGVIRSWHPTHSVAGWGRHARELLSTHHLGPTFGRTSPFYKLREYNGVVIGLGTRLRNAFTILHVPEELHPAARELAFDPRPRRMTIVNGSDSFVYEFRVMRTDVNREYARVEQILLREGVLRYLQVGGLQCAATHADAYIHRGLRLASENAYMLRTYHSLVPSAKSA